VAPPVERIRNIAVGLLVKDDLVLVEIYPATTRHGAFARLPGGGIEFGETALEAVHREFAEELAATLTAAEPVGVTENIFTSGGVRGHEVVHVFAIGSAALEALPGAGELRVLDNHTTVRWVPLSSLRADDPPLYPVGMIHYAETLAAASRPSTGQ
jgi:ADP-ribose pyrophosphatase YjhB (NUDIX family)